MLICWPWPTAAFGFKENKNRTIRDSEDDHDYDIP